MELLTGTVPVKNSLLTGTVCMLFEMSNKSTQICKHAKCTSMEACRSYAGMQVCKYASVKVCNYASKQLFRFGSIKVYKHENTQVKAYETLQVCITSKNDP